MLLKFLLFAGAAAAAPFSLKNGFPNPSASALQQIENEAGGTLPNGALPTSLQADAITALQVIAVNEIFEVAYFSSLLYNVTHNVHGFTDLQGQSKSDVVAALTAIRAQEELHAVGVNAILASAGAKTISPCNYHFPATDFKTAIATAALFTDVVLGALQSVAKTFALDGGQAAQGLVSLLASIIGQEGEQDGAYRLIGHKQYSAAPFLTAANGPFAFNAVAQNFLVPGSCPSSSNVDQIKLPTFKTLKVSTKGPTPQAKNCTLLFDTAATGVSASGNYLVYISGQNSPVVEKLQDVTQSSSGKTTYFKAAFPFSNGANSFSKGLTIAALVNSPGPFADTDAVSAATIAGPGLIEV